MGALANYPFALAPGMGINAYFAYTVCKGMGVDWRVGLGAVFLSGLIFLILTITRVRGAIIVAIPQSIKYAISSGIGVFIAFIGLHHAGVIAHHPVTFVTLGNLVRTETLLSLLGLLLIAILLARRVKGAILLGILFVCVLSLLFGKASFPERIFGLPDIGSTFLKLDVAGALKLGLLHIIFVFLFVDIFDTAGTLIGVSAQAGFLRNGKLPRAERAFFADAAGTIAGSLLGTSTVTSYIESAAGVAEGARTGLSSLFVSALFLLSIFFAPIAKIVPDIATAPALIIVGALMASGVLNIPWKDASESIPAFVAFVSIPLTYSIANGLALGFVLYPLVKLFSGRRREVHPLVWVLATLFLLRFIFLGRI
jgi:AGZA family xanthine/uracil permease-like MFS transporter